MIKTKPNTKLSKDTRIYTHNRTQGHTRNTSNHKTCAPTRFDIWIDTNVSVWDTVRAITDNVLSDAFKSTTKEIE